MSDQSSFDPEDYEGVQPKQTAISNAELRVLRKEAKKAQDLEARLAQMERQSALARAGIPDNPLGQMFADWYKGPLDDTEAIKAQWAEIAPPPGSGQQAAVDASLAGHQAAIDAANGAVPSSSQPDTGNDLTAILRKYEHLGQQAMANQGPQAIAEVKRLMHERGFQVEEQKRRFLGAS